MRLLLRQFLTAITLSLFAGVTCLWMSVWSHAAVFDLTTPLPWAMIFNRLLIGFVVFLSQGASCPLSHICPPAWLRGLFLGTLVSLGLALTFLFDSCTIVEIHPDSSITPLQVFFATLFSGGFWGLVIAIIIDRPKFKQPIIKKIK